MAKLSNTANPYNFAVDWDGIRDSVLDMATYCCSAMATKRYISCMYWPCMALCVCPADSAMQPLGMPAQEPVLISLGR